MFQSRDQIRQIYLDVWQKMQQQTWLEPMEAMIADIIQLHPEYHLLLQKGSDLLRQDFLPEQGESNPFLHMAMHITLREQANTDRPVGFKKIYQTCLKKHDQHDAEHRMMECLAKTLRQAQQNNAPLEGA